MARRMKEINESAEQGGDMLSASESDGYLIKAIKARYKENKEGRLNSLFYLYISQDDRVAPSFI